MDKISPKNQFLNLINRFIKSLKWTLWFEIFERWFGFGIKFIWLVLVILFGVYLRKEYQKDIYYLKNFDVPNSWVEEGYSGKVVKEMIIDEVDAIRKNINDDFWGDGALVPSRTKEDDKTEFLSEINVEGFNLKTVVNGILSLLGKRNKTIGGYITLDENSKKAAIQITDQQTSVVKIKKKYPNDSLIHEAALQVLKIKYPRIYLTYQFNKNDTVAIVNLVRFLEINKTDKNEFDYYIVKSKVSLFLQRYEEADALSDSLLAKFPKEVDAHTHKSVIYRYKAAFAKDTVEYKKFRDIYTQCILNGIEVYNPEEDNELTLNHLHILIADLYRTYNYKGSAEHFVLASKIRPLTSLQNNVYGYVSIKLKDFKTAEVALKNATSNEPQNSNYWDSLGEFYSITGKDSMAINCLQRALKAPIKHKSVTKVAYQKDARWDKIRKRPDFVKMMKEN
jgi:tetratricopeptide (TPR) repeat protein